MHLLPLGLESLETLTSKELNRYAMQGIDLTVHGDNTFVAQATNGRAALRVTGACVNNNPDNPFPPIAALDSAPNGECKSIIPGKEWKAAFTAAKKVKTIQPVLRSVAVVVGKEVTTLASTNLEALNFNQPRNLEGRFPPLADILRKPEEAFATCALTPSVVLDVFSALNKLCPDTPVNVDFYRNKAEPISFIGVRCQSTEIKIEGAFMPCGNTSPAKKNEATLAQVQDRADVLEVENSKLLEQCRDLAIDNEALKAESLELQSRLTQLESLTNITSIAAYLKSNRPELAKALREALS